MRGYVSLPAKELFEVVLDRDLPRGVPQELLRHTQTVRRVARRGIAGASMQFRSAARRTALKNLLSCASRLCCTT